MPGFWATLVILFLILAFLHHLGDCHNPSFIWQLEPEADETFLTRASCEPDYDGQKPCILWVFSTCETTQPTTKCGKRPEFGAQGEKVGGSQAPCQCLMNSSLSVVFSLARARECRVETKVRSQNQEVTPMLIFGKQWGYNSFFSRLPNEKG